MSAKGSLCASSHRSDDGPAITASTALLILLAKVETVLVSKPTKVKGVDWMAPG